MSNDVKTLIKFLNMPLKSSNEIMELFLKSSKNARLIGDGPKKSLFIEGTKKDRILLVAHADTVWRQENRPIKVSQEHNLISSIDYFNSVFLNKPVAPNALLGCGIGADDRAGIAMLWLLKDSGHSILITHEEENGAKSALSLRANKTTRDLLNNHNFMLELDKMGHKDFKVYNVGSKDFVDFIKNKTNYSFVPSSSFTDISFLCTDICGANLGVGYYREHTPAEHIIISQWQGVLDDVRGLLNQDLPKFKLTNSNNLFCDNGCVDYYVDYLDNDY